MTERCIGYWETTVGMGVVKVESADTIVFEFGVTDDQGNVSMVEKVVEKDLVNVGKRNSSLKGLASWCIEEFTLDGEVLVSVDKFYAQL